MVRIELPQAGVELLGLLESIELSLIEQALRRCEGNKTQASALLGLNRTTLVEKMRRHGMELNKPHPKKTA
jgi:two-component system, NtrC family, response regulator PilR